MPGVSEGSPSSLSQGLQKTRQSWLQGIASLLLGKKELNPLLLEELETHLLAADVGVETTQQLIDPLVQSLARKELQDGDLVLATLKQHLIQYLEPVCQPLTIPSSLGAPFVILGVGVNGVGKTTTLAKLARQWQLAGKKVMLAAGDTFRAAAIEQLQHWGEQYNIPVIAQGKGADSAAVIYDAYQSAKAKRVDILLADTAGRLHTQDHLMNELKKIKRVLEKISADLPQETLLVLDAGIGQNALRQAQQFNDAIGVTGLVITKLDGTAKGGIVFSLSKALSIPLRYIGIGESIADLHPFAAKDFVEAIFT
ncbi:MAG: signal recognition particle-docking protein FtsY [Legionellales bacterium RIFCSPHIGHO2_12_FULL_37_14]|nr:MAG: signal recognition particle-docking protein FtsY [Legionellales bacterium RIFCSPHIGHO2_12_FULL_37_14]